MNSGLAIAGSLPLVFLAFRQRDAGRDVVVFRAGLLIFVVFVLWGNTRNLLGYGTLEPYGFGLFLCCLGYVAAKRALDRDQQLASLHQELEVAKRIQLSILPTGFPVSEHFTVAARYVPMTAVAGDFYEFLSTGGPRAGLLVADVSGHGVPAALIASMVKIATSAQRHHAASPERLLAGVNEALCGSTQGQFVTAAYVYLDAERGELCYAAAGHPPMLLLRDGQVCSIEENGLVLGVFSSAAYSSTKQTLRKGDRLLLYTDGVIEAANGGEEEFGQERLGKLLATSASRTVEELADLILSTVQHWASTQTDDLTVVVCECHSSGHRELHASYYCFTASEQSPSFPGASRWLFCHGNFVAETFGQQLATSTGPSTKHCPRTIYRTTLKDWRRPEPKRNTEKCSSSDATSSTPSRRITAKLVRSTMEKSWSRQSFPISQATSRSAKPTASMTATPLLMPSQNRSAALRLTL